MMATPQQPTQEVFVVDDTPEDALLATKLLEKAGFLTRHFSTGAEVLAALEARAKALPALVLTDLVMPEMDGLEIVEQIRLRFPPVPVILVTAHGSGEVAFRALKKGAASYVSKRRILEELVDSVEDVLAVAHAEREQAELRSSLTRSEFRFAIGNDQRLITSLVRFVRDKLLARFPDLEETTQMQVGMAIQEALRNAMHHGNLEVTSELRQRSSRDYDALVEKRLADLHYGSRTVRIGLEISPVEIRCVVLDEGPGFDPSTVPNPTDPANLLRASGRGLFLISTFMDEVRHNDKGNEITMVKRLDGGLQGADD